MLRGKTVHDYLKFPTACRALLTFHFACRNRVRKDGELYARDVRTSRFCITCLFRELLKWFTHVKRVLFVQNRERPVNRRLISAASLRPIARASFV